MLGFIPRDKGIFVDPPEYLRFMSNVAATIQHAHVHLSPGKEKSLMRGHPWVFSGAIGKIEVDEAEPAAGDWVRVIAASGAFIGWGHWGTGSIAVRLLSREDAPAPPNADWWTGHLSACLDVRKHAGLYGSDEANANGFRWIHGEGDGLSGLVVDFYAGLAVVQTHSMGMHRALPEIVTGLKNAMPSLKGVVNKSTSLLKKLNEAGAEDGSDGWLWSDDDMPLPHPFLEHGLQYEVDPIAGQKTGFFLDQRENRRLLMEMVGDRSVLNAFSYTGGFSMAALRGGSSHVVSLDASQAAVNLASRHAELNGFSSRHEAICGDVLHHLKSVDTLPEVVILDPPAYAKSRNARHKAVQGYKRLNETALRKMPSGGLLWTFSCSQVVDAQLFEDTIVAAAIASGRKVRILKRLGQPADHPTMAGHSEARYLKGLILHIG